MAKFKWGLFIVLVSSFVSLILTTRSPPLPWAESMFAVLIIQIVGYLFVFLDRDVWDAPKLLAEMKRLYNDTNNRLKEIEQKLHVNDAEGKSGESKKPITGPKK